MRTYLITGSSGFIGMSLARRLMNENQQVNLLVRSPAKIRHLEKPGVQIFQGDITDPASVENAMAGCTHVFHLAAHARSFEEDPQIFDRINTQGTQNVLEAALKLGVKRVVFTSTAGTFGVTTADVLADENSERPEILETDYARTKRKAEKLCNDYYQRGLDIVTVYPTRVYGPGVINESNSLTKLLNLVLEGKWRVIPGDGKTYGNYVFVDDVVNGLLLALEKGKKGEDYILGGENLTFDELFGVMKTVTGSKTRMFHAPFIALYLAAGTMVAYAHLTGNRPLISPAWVKRYLSHRKLSSLKAVEELGYHITPLSEGFRTTVNWILHHKISEETQTENKLHSNGIITSENIKRNNNIQE